MADSKAAKTSPRDPRDASRSDRAALDLAVEEAQRTAVIPDRPHQLTRAERAKLDQDVVAAQAAERRPQAFRLEWTDDDGKLHTGKEALETRGAAVAAAVDAENERLREAAGG